MDLAQPRAVRRPDCPHLASFLKQSQGYTPCGIELIPDQPTPDHIEAVAVVRIKAHHYRCLILYAPWYPGGIGLYSAEGDRDDVARTLRRLRVPVLTVKGPARF